MRATRTDLPVAAEMPGYESRQTQWGDLNLAIETIAGGMDATELFAALPGGRCSCPHWGYVVKGRARIKYATTRRSSPRVTRTTCRRATFPSSRRTR